MSNVPKKQCTFLTQGSRHEYRSFNFFSFLLLFSFYFDFEPHIVLRAYSQLYTPGLLLAVLNRKYRVLMIKYWTINCNLNDLPSFISFQPLSAGFFFALLSYFLLTSNVSFLLLKYCISSQKFAAPMSFYSLVSQLHPNCTQTGIRILTKGY